MKTMIARYPGTCQACGEAICRGDKINFFGRGTAEHATCRNASDDSDAERYEEDEAAGLERGTLANDRRMAKRDGDRYLARKIVAMHTDPNSVAK